METTDRLYQNRMSELSHRAFTKGCCMYSEFLTLAEQDELCRMSFDSQSAPFEFLGGYEAAERRLARFGDAETRGYSDEPPIDCLAIEPVSKKYSEDLTHRDFLGALTALGVRRSVMGDIVVGGNNAYLFCLESVAEFIAEQLTSVRRTAVTCRAVEKLPDIVAQAPIQTAVTSPSERLDAVIAAVWKLSRSAAQSLFDERKIFVNGRMEKEADSRAKPGDIVSARGYGRFLYDGPLRETKRGRLCIGVRIY